MENKDIDTKENNQNSKNDGNNSLNKKRLIIIVLCALVVICVGGYLIYNYYQKYKAKNAFEDLIEDVETKEPDDESLIPKRDIDWDKLKEANEDIYAWVYIPDTKVDYPVLQHPTDDSYYLLRNLDKSEGYPGCVFSEHTYNSTDFTDANTILYAHNMRDGSMFASLHKFREKEFYDKHRYIFIYTPEKNYAYEIFYAMEIDDRHLLDSWDFSLEGVLDFYEQELVKLGSGGNMDTERVFSDDDRVITLSTCATTSGDDRRFIVQGVVVEEQ